MTRHAAAVASLTLLTGSLLAVNTAPAPRPVERPVAELIQSLGSADYAERETATRDLDRVGPAALPELFRTLTQTTDGEVYRRGLQLITRIEKRLADERILAPTMVEIDADGKTVEEIATQLSKQSGFAVVASGAGKKVTLKTGKVSFWQAIDHLCDTADMQIASVGGMSAPATKAAQGEPTIKTRTIGDIEIEPLKPAQDPAAKLLELKKDLEKIAKARADVAKEVNATAKARAEALEKIQAEAEAKIKAVAAAVAVQKAAAKAPPVLVAAPPAIEPPVANYRAPKTAPAGGSNTIVLEPRTGEKRPAINVGAVRLEAFPLPASVAVADSVATLVQVWAEPKLQWQQTRSVRVRQARDDQGQTLAADPSGVLAGGPTVIDGNGMQMVQNVNGGVIIVNGGGRLVINGQINGNIVIQGGGNVVINGNQITPQQPGTFTPNPRQVVVKLQPGDKPSDTLKEFAGILEAVIRTAPEPLVTISDFSKPTEKTHACGARLKTGTFTKADDGSYSLEVELQFDGNTVQAAAPAGESHVPSAPGLRRDLQMRVRDRAPVVPSTSGLRVTDEAGQPFTLRSQQQNAQFDGISSTLKFTLALVPDAKTMGEPKSIAFWGIRSASVDVPFRFADVPALAASK